MGSSDEKETVAGIVQSILSDSGIPQIPPDRFRHIVASLTTMRMARRLRESSDFEPADFDLSNDPDSLDRCATLLDQVMQEVDSLDVVTRLWVEKFSALNVDVIARLKGGIEQTRAIFNDNHEQGRPRTELGRLSIYMFRTLQKVGFDNPWSGSKIITDMLIACECADPPQSKLRKAMYDRLNRLR